MDWVLRRYPGYTEVSLREADAHGLMQLRAILDPEAGQA
jgi:hypothetical protein